MRMQGPIIKIRDKLPQIWVEASPEAFIEIEQSDFFVRFPAWRDFRVEFLSLFQPYHILGETKSKTIYFISPINDMHDGTYCVHVQAQVRLILKVQNTLRKQMLVTGRAKLVVSRGGQRYVLFQTDDHRFSYPLAQNMNKSIYPEIFTSII